MNRQRWQDWITLALGLWTIASPFLLVAQSGMLPMTAEWNFLAVGAALALVGIVALYSHRLWEEWIDVGLGAWLVISPWVLGFTSETTLKWDAVITGLVVVALAGSVLASSMRAGRPA